MIVGLRRIVEDELHQIPDCFDNGELAYLSLTGKLEVPFQEKLAWLLHGWASGQGLCVTKEWSRESGKHVDIAILKDGEPEALLELKAMVTSDPLRQIKTADRSLSELKHDLERWSGYSADTIGILVAAHRKNLVPEKWTQLEAVRYWQGDVYAFRTFKTESAILSACASRVRDFFKDYEVDQVVLPDGGAFETRVDVAIWVISTTNKLPDSGLTS